MAKLVNRLREMRKRAKLTLPEVGDRMGVSHTTIMRYEKGESPLDIDTIKALAQIYGCGELELVTDVEAFAEGEQEQALLSLARELEPAQRELLLGVVRSMHKPSS